MTISASTPTIGPEPDCLGAARGWRGGCLETPRLRIRALRAVDAAALARLADDWEVARFTAEMPHPFTESHAEAFIAKAAADATAGRRFVFALEDRVSAALLGCAGLTLEEDRTAEIGYWLGRSFWGHGLAAEAVLALLRLGFGSLGIERIHADVMADNAISARVLAKAGFRDLGEGIGGRGRCRGKPVHRLEARLDVWRAREAAKPLLLVAAVALVDADGRVLMARRPEGKSMAGLWEFPGGKLRDGETPEAALMRELREELGIGISESCLAACCFASHPYEDFHLLMPLYVCRAWRGRPEPREGQTLRWVRPNRMGELPMPPADLPLIAPLRDLL